MCSTGISRRFAHPLDGVGSLGPEQGRRCCLSFISAALRPIHAGKLRVMEMHQVRYFLALCRHGSSTRAAEKIGQDQE